MDSFTHIALGACMGEAFAGKQLGKKAMVWGALAQSIPDIDFLASFWADTSSNLLAHRGLTHSFLFCALITPVFAFIAERFNRPNDISFRKWVCFFGVVIFIHVFIDAFNSYGVGWFEPFSHKRISFNAMYVADPFFSIWPGIAGIGLVFFKRSSVARKKCWVMGLGLSGLYLLYCLYNKSQINSAVKKNLAKQHIGYARYFTTPAPLQNWLWFVVAGTDSGYYAGYRSLFDRADTIALQYFPRNTALLQPLADNEEVHRLLRFAQQFYTVEKYQDTLVFNDLRFGQELGWDNPHGKFAFHYYLGYPKKNTLVIQRGRLAGWNEKTFHSFVKRVEGN